jgi:hypothetical protein
VRHVVTFDRLHEALGHAVTLRAAHCVLGAVGALLF